MKSRGHVWVVIIAVCALVSMSCSLGGLIAGRQEEVVVPSRTPRPTFTPTPGQPDEPSQPSEPATVPATKIPRADTPVPPTAIPEPPTPTPQPPTPTPVPAPFVVVISEKVNVRSGPSTAYERLGQITQGQRYDITGKNGGGDWWQICCVDGGQVWVTTDLVDPQGDLGQVSLVGNIPPPPPTSTPRPTDTPAPTPTPAPQYSFTVIRPAEGRPNPNPWVTVYGQLWDRTNKLAVTGRTVRVSFNGVKLAEGVSSYAEGAEGGWSWAYGGYENAFIYNLKIEIPSAPNGSYEAVIVQGDKPLVEPIPFTVTAETREFVLAWKEK